MAVDTATHISGLNVLLPTGRTAAKRQTTTFATSRFVSCHRLPNIGGPVTATHAELNYVDGVTSAIQDQLDPQGASADPCADWHSNSPHRNSRDEQHADCHCGFCRGSRASINAQTGVVVSYNLGLVLLRH